MTRDEWEYLEKLLPHHEVKFAMRGRCEEQGHQFENGMSAAFQMVEICKWCGERRTFK
jgi:hypothetical protein